MQSTAHAPAARPQGTGRPISVLIVDDSVVARAALARTVAADSAMVVAAAVDSAAQAIAFLASSTVDVVLLDIEMPGRDGLSALPDLLAAGRGAHVLIVASTAAQGAEATIRALALGASDTLAKPEASGMGAGFGGLLLDRIARLGRARTAAPAPQLFPLIEGKTGPVRLAAIGASTGGLKALAELFQALPPSFSAPILVTQHLPPSFMPYFADQLALLSRRPTRVAVDRHEIAAGEILVAPGTAHLTVSAGTRLRVRLSNAPSASRCCPSVDPMLASIAHTLGDAAVGIVLSGMGRDGLLGGRAMVAAGATMLVQNEASSTIWGMPGVIARDGAGRHVGRVQLDRPAGPT